MKAKLQQVLGLTGLLLVSSLQANPPELTPRQYEELTHLGDALHEQQLDQVFELGNPLYENPRGSSEQKAFVRAFVARVLAQAYQQKGDLKAATGILEDALGHAKDLDEQTLQALRWLLIQVLTGQGEYAKALNQLELWWQAEEEPNAQAHYLRSALLAQLEQWQQAEPWVLNALELRSVPPDSWRALAVAIYQHQEKWAEASEHQAKRLEVSPERPRLWSQLAQLQKLAGRPQEALVTQELAQRRGYLSSREQEVLGHELLNAGQPLRAAKVFEQLLEKSPQEETAERLRLAAQAWLQTGQPQPTATALKRLAKATQSQDDWRRLADWHFSQGNWEAAIQAWEELKPGLTGDALEEVELLMANAHIELQNYEQARVLLEELLESSKETAARQWINYLDALQ
jgi:tetratricopeptide (TPR) repeat protein